MKRFIVSVMLVLCLLLLSGCGDAVNYNKMPEDVARVRRVADAALTETYGFEDFSSCEIKIAKYAQEKTEVVSYELEIFGYSTPEEYSVKVNSNGEVESVDGSCVGAYSCFISEVTRKDILRAEAALDEKLSWGEEPDYFLMVDNNGDLYLKFYKVYEMYVMTADGGCVPRSSEVSHQELVCEKP